MPRGLKIGLILVGIVVVLSIAGSVALFVGISQLKPRLSPDREMNLANHGTLIIEGAQRGRSEHGFSQRAGYRPPGSAEIEWFGDVSDGVQPQFYQSGPLVVVIDPPGAQLYIRTVAKNWKDLALVFPNDLGPFPISFYAERTGLTTEEVSRINELGGKREQKYPTTYIQSFDPETRDLRCSYWVDNKSSWPLQFRLSEDGTRLALIAIGGSSP
jgi:hypothetical protein